MYVSFTDICIGFFYIYEHLFYIYIGLNYNKNYTNKAVAAKG